MALQFDIAHLCEVPEHRPQVAELIHEEFWVTVQGASAEGMARRLGEAGDISRLPLCLVALHQGRPIGTVNLVDNDDDSHRDWHPWLAGMVVDRAWRGQGVGSALVQALLAHARRLGFARVYFGTDGPGFYARLGAVVHQQPRPGFWFMRFELAPVVAGASAGAGGSPQAAP
jgi:predicted N-acetyltransferase YhbS